MDRAAYVELLRQLGHYRCAVVRKESGRFYVECECGYRSTTRATMREAVGTVEHHRRKVLRESRIHGVSVPAVGKINL